MKTQNELIRKLLILSLLILGLACSKDDDGGDGTDPVDPIEANTFEEVIALGADVESFPQSRTEEVLNESAAENEDYEREEEGEIIKERFVCTRKTLSVLDGNGQFPLFDTASDVIYPGSLLQGKSLKNATPSPIVVKRAGGTISYNLINGNQDPSFTVDEVTKSSIQTGMNRIIDGSPDAVPANFQLDIVQIESESQMALELGVDVQTWTTKVSSDMSFSTEKSFNRTLVKLTQSYYTMSFDLPTSLEEIFDESVTPEDLKTYVQADNPATFISSVTYGRIFYMLIESTSSRQEMSAKLNVAYGKFGNTVEGELEASAMQELNDLKIKVIAYGGDAAGTFKLAGETTIADIADKLAESTDIRTGLPLSYVVRSVERPDKIVGTRLATEYDVVDCELKGILPPGLYSELLDLFEDGIGAMANLFGSDVLIFNKAGDKYAWFNANAAEILSDGNRRIFSIHDPEGPLGELQLENVGAAARFPDDGDPRLYISDLNGFKLQIFRFDPYTANVLPPGPIGSSGGILLVNEIFGDSGNFVIGTDGFEAGLRVGAVRMAYFGKPGERYQVYDRSGSGTWWDTVSATDWFESQPKVGGTQFEKVGAATTFTLGGSSARYLFVNEAGDEIQEWFSFGSEPDRWNGPWVIN